MTDHTQHIRDLLEQALEVIVANTTGKDDLEAAIRAELAKTEASHTAMQLAAMVLSDCGISTDFTALLMVVAARITRHEDGLIENVRNLAKPAQHDAPEVDALKAERDAAVKDAERYRWCVSNNMVLSGGVSAFGWPIAPVGRSEWDGYIDAAIAKSEGRTE